MEVHYNFFQPYQKGLKSKVKVRGSTFIRSTFEFLLLLCSFINSFYVHTVILSINKKREGCNQTFIILFLSGTYLCWGAPKTNFESRPGANSSR